MGRIGHHAPVIRDHHRERAMSAATRARSAAASDGVLPLVRLLQLASPALPIGAYSYSQGIEWMIDSRAIRRRTAAAQQWIGDVLEHVVADGEAAVLWRLLRRERARRIRNVSGTGARGTGRRAESRESFARKPSRWESVARQLATELRHPR